MRKVVGRGEVGLGGMEETYGGREGGRERVRRQGRKRC